MTVVALSRYYSQKKSTGGCGRGHGHAFASDLASLSEGNKWQLMVCQIPMVKSSATSDFASLKEEYASLSSLLNALRKMGSLDAKLEVLDEFCLVRDFLEISSPLRSFLEGTDKESQYVIKAVAAIGQAERVLAHPRDTALPVDELKKLIGDLLAVEKFYEKIGGIIGYHCLMLECLIPTETPPPFKTRYHDPEAIDISEETEEVRRAIVEGIKRLGEMAEIYPVGGAADRLNLQDESGTPLPAAKLPFCGRNLLEGLIVDLQAREYLHYKLFGKQLCTPVLMMTSYEKDNHAQILSICSEKGWFGRPKNSFRFVSQPSVPSMNKKGHWCLQGSFQLLLKPSGHGVIWKLAQQEKTFDWLASQGRKKALVRQINNPLAGIDHGLLAFTGLGCNGNKIFGFASCSRKPGAAEGVNVLLEKDLGGSVEYVLTNIEYSDLQKLSHAGYTERKFANTNILFIDLKAVEEAVEVTPFPGVLINPKKMSYRRGSEVVEEEVARLESTMQNIADCFAESFSEPLPPGRRKEAFKTFLTVNSRKKTISTVKRAYIPGGALDETPEGCFLDLLENAKELLFNECKMKIEASKSTTHSLLFSYHPALGPLYSIIAQKVRGGRIHIGSELRLEIAELDMENLDLAGSLSIVAEAVMGHREQSGLLCYSEKTGKCVLKNVRVQNTGVDWESNQIPWKGEIVRKEECKILLEGDGELYAENVTFSGPVEIRVEAGTRVTVKQDGSSLSFQKEKIKKSQKLWDYTLTEDFRIVLKKI